jgi:hypothetical protein
MVHVTSSLRSCESETEDSQSDGVGCGTMEVNENILD